MKKGFSIEVSVQNIDVKSFISGTYDDFYLQTEQFDFLFEGVLLNRKKLLQQNALNSFETFVRENYIAKKENIIKEFEGEFRGFILDKINKKVFVFTSATSSQRIFYGNFEGRFFVDTSLVRLNKHLKKSGIPTQPDLLSIYQLLCFSNLPEDKTPIENIKKILDGNFIEIDCERMMVKQKEFFSLSKIPLFSHSKNQAIDKIHEIFTDSIVMEYEKDLELGKNHLALLSGGLDSRVAMLYAIQNDLKPENALCFSQSGYWDHTISEKIAKDFNVHYEFIPLDKGKFLTKIDELTEISEGMIFYTGGIHVKHAIEKMQYENFALFHSGQIGDGILGGFNTEPKRKRPSRFKIVVNQKFLAKVENSLEEMLKNYETEELFLLRNVAFNRTLLGAHVFEEKCYQTSPFMTKDFLEFAISLPEAWKFNHRFYLEWISKYCKEATEYRWERTLMKPNAHWKTTFGDQYLKRGFKILNEKVLKTSQNSSMYPYQFYFDNDVEIQKYYQNYFDENLHRIEEYKELTQDVTELYNSPNFFTKSQAINVLSIFKLFFD